MSHQTKITSENINPVSAHTMGADFIDDDHVITYPNETGPAYIFMRGCSENYRELAPMYIRRLGHLGQLNFEYQLGGLHDQDQINHGVITACERAGSRDKVFISTSMGHMNTVRALSDKRVRAALGNGSLRGVISLSGIESRADLQPTMRRMVAISPHIIDLPVVRAFWQKYRLAQAGQSAIRAAGNEALLHYKSSALMPPALVASQHAAIAKSRPFAYGELIDVVRTQPNLELHQISAVHDAVASWVSSRRSMSDTFAGLHVETAIDFDRHDGSHADDLHYSNQLATRMAYFSDMDQQASSFCFSEAA